GDFHHVFLVHHHAVGFFELLLEYRVRIGYRRRVVVALDEFGHHAAAGHTGPDDGRGGNQRGVIVAPQLGEQLPHGGALDVEAADGVGALELGGNLRVGEEPLGAVRVDDLPGVLPHDLAAVLDVADAPLAQDVELLEAEIGRASCRGRAP